MIKAYTEYRNSGYEWLGEYPSHWKLIKAKYLFSQVSYRNHPNEELLSVYRDYGVISRYSRDDNYNRPALDLSNYKLVRKEYLVINKMKAWQGSMGISELEAVGFSELFYILLFVLPLLFFLCQ